MYFRALTLRLLAGTSLAATSAHATMENEFDRLWQFGTLYESSENPIVQKFALSGRLQAEATWFDADQGDFNDALWRRFRFGFKSELFDDWVLHLEGNFDLNDDLDDSYSNLTDAYIGWFPNKQLSVKALKQSAGFTLDGATSSKKLLTLERNNLTNNLWFTAEYFTGVLAAGSTKNQLAYKVGVFSSDGDDELSRFSASYFTLLSLGYDYADKLTLDRAAVRFDYVHNDEHSDANTRDFSQVLSLTSHWQAGPWGLRTDLSAGDGYNGQSDVWGLVVMPYYNFTPMLQLVSRYTYISSSDDNGVRFGRYEREIAPGKGDQYNELYGGLNVFIYGHKLKWQTGLQYTSMDDDTDSGGEYDGWGLTTGLRLSW